MTTRIRIKLPGGSKVVIRRRGADQPAQISNQALLEQADAPSFIPLLPVQKKHVDQQIVLGIVLEPGTKRDGTVDDTQGSVIGADEIERAAHLWLARYQNRGLQHQKIVNSKVEIYESYVAPANMTVGGKKVKKGTWLLMYHILDSDLWQKVKKGEIAGFSMGGFAKKRPVKSTGKGKGKGKKTGKGRNLYTPRKR